MAHLRSSEVRQLLHNKYVVVLGDSVQRAVYKDLVVLLQKDSLLSTSQLKAKGELTFEGDILLEGGRWGRMHNGTRYREVRQFRSDHHLVRFYFITRVFSSYVVRILEDLRQGAHAPDVVVINSCLWDLSRYRWNFPRGYRANLESLFRALGQVLPASCLLVWNTAMPVAKIVSGGFLPPAQRLRGARLRQDVIEANFYSSVEAGRHGFDVLDLHFYFRHAWQHRQGDGVHWDQLAHRHLSQLLLAHVAQAWGVDLPRRYLITRWIRDGRASSTDARGGRRQPWHDGDHSSQQARSRPSASWSARAPRRPSIPIAQPPPLLLSSDRGVRELPHPRFQPWQANGDRSHPGQAHERIGRPSIQQRLGPVRRVSAYQSQRRWCPYSSQRRSWPHGHPRWNSQSRGFRSHSRGFRSHSRGFRNQPNTYASSQHSQRFG